jgi:hypothetical protein
MWEVAKKYVAMIAGDYFVDCDALIVYRGEPLVTVKRRTTDNMIGVDMEVFAADGTHAASIRNGKVNYLNPKRGLNDYLIEGRKGIFRVTERETNLILCETRRVEVKDLIPSEKMLIDRLGADEAKQAIAFTERTLGRIASRVDYAVKVAANFPLPDGTVFQASPHGWTYGAVGFGNFMEGCGVGISLGGRGPGGIAVSGVAAVAPDEREQMKHQMDRDIRLAAADEWAAAESGNECDESGEYRASGCDHTDTIQMVAGDIFPPCARCNQKVVWTIEAQSV